MEQRIFKLKGKIKNYDWGGSSFLPMLLNLKNQTNIPFAEYWLGVHTSAISYIELNDEYVPLNDFIEQDPERALGKEVRKKYETIPFLFKLLDVNKMLSIQVHPSKEDAKKGFEEENSRHVPLDGSVRNFKDDNHKPEMLIALSEFWLLHGFKIREELLAMLEQIPEFNSLIPTFIQSGYKGLYSLIMDMPQQEIKSILKPLVDRIMSGKSYIKSDPAFWIKKFHEEQPSIEFDRGIFSIYFFNIVKLESGQGLFQGAGLPHAYLLGQCVELMSNSDNVLRGGLTSKHIDVTQLLNHINFESTRPEILKIDNKEHEKKYVLPTDEFGLSAIELSATDQYQHLASSPEICISLKGEIEFREQNIILQKGEAVYILPGSNYTIQANKHSLIFKAYVPSTIINS